MSGNLHDKFMFITGRLYKPTVLFVRFVKLS